MQVARNSRKGVPFLTRLPIGTRRPAIATEVALAVRQQPTGSR